VNSSTHALSLPKDGDSTFWSFMKTVVEISADILLFVLLAADEQKGTEVKSTVFQVGDGEECKFVFEDSTKTMHLQNDTQSLTCSCTIADVDDDGQPTVDYFEVGPGGSEEVTSKFKAHPNGTCGLSLFVAPLGNGTPVSRASFWLQAFKVGAWFTFGTGATAMSMAFMNQYFAIRNNSQQNFNFRINVGIPQGLTFEVSGTTGVNREQRTPYPNNTTLPDNGTIDSASVEIGRQDVQGIARTALESRLGLPGDSFGPYFLKYVGGNCNPEMALTATGGNVILMPLNSSSNQQQWTLEPVFNNRGSKYFGFKIMLNGDSNVCLQFAGNKMPLKTAAYGQGSPEFVWVISPSQSDPDSVLIQPYTYAGEVCVDVPHGTCTTGTSIQAYSRNDTNPQHWQFVT